LRVAQHHIHADREVGDNQTVQILITGVIEVNNGKWRSTPEDIPVLRRTRKPMKEPDAETIGTGLEIVNNLYFLNVTR
jgi:hypothetical protein